MYAIFTFRLILFINENSTVNAMYGVLIFVNRALKSWILSHAPVIYTANFLGPLLIISDRINGVPLYAIKIILLFF